ncbi:probable ATP-dependent RNA helicase DHR1 [Diutina catenulata]
MGTYRKRHNEKARTGMLAKQAALKKARQKQFNRVHDDGTSQPEDAVAPAEEPVDTNAEVLVPMTAAEKEERKRKLAEEIYTDQSESKMSRSKRKRLDKYIEHQLKREEKKVLLQKLSETKVDTKMLAASKTLGQGKQTKREQMMEALKLEREGRGNEHTRDLLYEERVVKEWDADSDDENAGEEKGSDASGSDDDDDDEDDMAQFGDTPSSFIDHRPKKMGGMGGGFGFAGLPKIEKAPATKKYSWRLKVAKEEAKKRKKEDDMDFMSSEEEEEAQDEDADSAEVDDSDEESASGQSDSGSESEESGEDDNEEEDDEDEVDEGEDEKPRLLQMKPKHTDTARQFKEWANQYVRKIEGRDHEEIRAKLPEHIRQQILNQGVREEDKEHLSDDEGYIRTDDNLQRDAFFVEVKRDMKVQAQRIGLPVYAEESRIMEAVFHHDCIVICGETGSGKTTQVPQFLYEAGFGDPSSPLTPGMIGVTQPRRVAAVSMAQRVGNEMGDHGHRVGHQIRFDSTIANEGAADGTALKFMTDGVLLREMMTDFMLTKYSAIIIDEAHERNINTDILIGMLSRVLKLRRQYFEKDPKAHKPLKLIIMSATLRVTDFSENPTLFPVSPPVIKVDARQFDVAIHFNKRTQFDYMEDAYNKVCKIHRRLPPGGILVFLTGQSEITTLVAKLRKQFPFKKKKPVYSSNNLKVQVSKHAVTETEDVEFAVEDSELAGIAEEQAEDHDDYDSEDEEGFEEELEEHQSPDDPLYVLPLYSLLPTSEQMKVFEKPPPGSRVCIVATNVAETSLTIPGIRYVVDAGRAKERRYNEESGVQSFEVDWISKASAGQRAGRAGRTGPGHCYRLYSSAIYEQYFEQFSKPEILRMPFESIVLSMKSMGINHIANFPFPTPPNRQSLVKAERLLSVLGALDKEGAITDLGKTMALFPLSPRYAKVLIIGNQLQCLPYVIALVSAFSVGDPFISENELGISEASLKPQVDESSHKKRDDYSDDEEDSKKPVKIEQENPADKERRRAMRQQFHVSRAAFAKLDPSDMFVLLSAVCAFDHVPRGDERTAFLTNNFLRGKMMGEIEKLRRQIHHLVVMYTTDDVINDDHGALQLGVPTKQQILAIKQMIASGFIDQVAIRGDLVNQDVRITNNTAITRVPYAPVLPMAEAPFVFLHPNSILCSAGKQPPQYLVYHTLNSSVTKNDTLRVTLKPLVEISGKQLANIAKSSPLITYSKPLGHPYAPKNLTPKKRECYVVPRFGASMGSSGVGWDLPVIKVTQVKKQGSWVTEK